MEATTRSLKYPDWVTFLRNQQSSKPNSTSIFISWKITFENTFEFDDAKARFEIVGQFFGFSIQSYCRFFFLLHFIEPTAIGFRFFPFDALVPNLSRQCLIWERFWPNEVHRREIHSVRSIFIFQMRKISISPSKVIHKSLKRNHLNDSKIFLKFRLWFLLCRIWNPIGVLRKNLPSSIQLSLQRNRSSLRKLQAISTIISIGRFLRPWSAWPCIAESGGTGSFGQYGSEKCHHASGIFIRCVWRFEQTSRHSDLLFIPEDIRVESSTSVRLVCPW
jgi:hypothetical protein